MPQINAQQLSVFRRILEAGSYLRDLRTKQDADETIKVDDILAAEDTLDERVTAGYRALEDLETALRVEYAARRRIISGDTMIEVEDMVTPPSGFEVKAETSLARFITANPHISRQELRTMGRILGSGAAYIVFPGGLCSHYRTVRLAGILPATVEALAAVAREAADTLDALDADEEESPDLDLVVRLRAAADTVSPAA